MNRRGFLGALAAVVAAGKAAPQLLAKLVKPTPLAYEEMPLGLIDAIGGGVVTPGPYTMATLNSAYRKMQPYLFRTYTSMSPAWDLFDDDAPSMRLTHRSSGFAAWERQVLG